MLKAFVIMMVALCGGMLMGEGVFGAAVVLICTVLSGLIAYNFFEPLAGLIESQLTFTTGYGDFLSLLILFSIVVTILRVITENTAPTMVEFPDIVHRGGGLLMGAWTGWVLAGILIAAMQTLPWRQDFMGYQFDAGVRPAEFGSIDNGAWNVDRQWLAFMHKVSGKVIDHDPPTPFDPLADYAMRYERFRRVDAEGKTSASSGEGSGSTRSGGRSSSGGGGRRRSGA